MASHPSFLEWLLTQRQHPRIGPFAIWVWSEASPVKRNAKRLAPILLYLDVEPHCKWREPCLLAHRLYRKDKKMREQAVA